MKRTLLTHVGVPKAGSTSIQNMLLTRVRALARCGIHVPRAGSQGRIVGEHNGLAAGFGNASSGPDHWPRLAAEIRRSRAHRFVISAEHLSARNRWRCAERLLELAAREDLEIEVVGYVRPQWQILEAAYTQQVKAGRIGATFEAYLARRLGAQDNGLDYNDVFAPYREAFGGRVRVYPLEYGRPAQGLLGHFVEVLGAPVVDRISLRGLPSANLRLGAKALEAMRLARAAANALRQPLGWIGKRVPWLPALLEDDQPFTGFTASSAGAVMERFASANARFARAYGIDAGGELFRDLGAGRTEWPTRANWADFALQEQRLVRTYLQSRLGVDIDPSGAGAAAPWAVRARIARSAMRLAAALPARWREFAAYPGVRARARWLFMLAAGWLS